jgi:hypothetical protein
MQSVGADGRPRHFRAKPVFMRLCGRFALQGSSQRMAHSNGQVSHYCSAGFESRFGIRTRDHVAPGMGVNGCSIGPVVVVGARALMPRNWGTRAFHGLHATLWVHGILLRALYLSVRIDYFKTPYEGWRARRACGIRNPARSAITVSRA